MSSEATPAAADARARPGRVVAAVLLIVLIAFVAVLATRESGDSRGRFSSLIGRPAPAVRGETLDGDRYEMPARPGEYIVVNFFATWCVPCIREHPELVNFSRRHRAAGDASVVSVLYDTRVSAAAGFFEENGGDWPVVLDTDGRIALTFGVSGVPESYLVGPDGRVVVKLVGGVSAAELDRLVAEAEELRSP